MNFYCEFCDRRCYKLTWDSDWWHCGVCNVEYSESNPARRIFKVNFNNKSYTVTLTDNKTYINEVHYFPALSKLDIAMQRETTILTLSYPIQNLNPVNILVKLRTILTFQ